MTILGSREQYCIHSKVKKSDNKNEDCKTLLEFGDCKQYRQAHKIKTDLKSKKTHVFDIEDLVRIGKRVGGCPYFASRSLAVESKVDVVCTHALLLMVYVRTRTSTVYTHLHSLYDARLPAPRCFLRSKQLYSLHCLCPSCSVNTVPGRCTEIDNDVPTHRAQTQETVLFPHPSPYTRCQM